MNIIEITSSKPLSHTKIKIVGKYVTIKTYLDVDNFVSAVRTIANSCFTEVGYRPEFKEVAKRYVVLKYFTDIDLGDMSVEEVFKVSQNGWYYEIEKTIADYAIYADMLDAVDEVIRYRLATAKTSFDELCDEVKDIANRLTEKQEGDMDSVNQLLSRLSGINDEAVVKAIIGSGENGES